jgi:hypothetical protein
MSAPSVTHDTNARRHGTLRLLLVAAVVIIGVLLAANAHLVYVAFSSQPDCVIHLKGEGEPGTFRAAKSAC